MSKGKRGSGEILVRALACLAIAVLGAALWGVAPARAQDTLGDEGPPAWAIGFRLGNERQQGAVDDAYSSQLFPGPVGSLFIERTLHARLRLGFAMGAADSTRGATTSEEDYTRLSYEPYLRAVAFPGHFTPYFLASAGVYHAFAGGSLSALDQKSGGFTWSAGGGFDIPIVDDFTFGIEARFRSYAREGSNAKAIEIMAAPHLWVR